MKIKVIFLLLMIYTFPFVLNGQINNDDKIYKKNGEVITCKLLKISDNKIRIDPKGEISLSTINGEEVDRIELGDGMLINFPLQPNFIYEAGEVSYDTPDDAMKSVKKQKVFVSFFGGIYKGDEVDKIMGFQPRFDDSSVFGLKGSVFYRGIFPLIVGYNVVLSFSKYKLMEELLLVGEYSSTIESLTASIEGTAINLDMSGELVLLDVSTLYIPNPYLLAGFGLTRFLGDEIDELDLSLNYGAGFRVNLSSNFGICMNIKNRVVYIKDMGSPVFTEISCGLFYSN